MDIKEKRDEPFPVIHHKNMLSDHVRINGYQQAIKKYVNRSSCVVEIGTGTGILSALAAFETDQIVYSIEYFDRVAKFSEQNFSQCSINNIEVINARSYDVKIKEKVDILITETIGPVGPEENIVQLCYDFVKRHPSVHRIIPSKLTLFLQPLWADRVEIIKNEIFKDYQDINFGKFHFRDQKSYLLSELCQKILEADLSNAIPQDSAVQIVQYELGFDLCPDFNYDYYLPDKQEVNCLQIYFEAMLDEKLILSSSCLCKHTHWGNNYIMRPENARFVRVTYCSKTNNFFITWGQ